MSAQIPPSQPIRFAAYELDLRAGELRKHGIRIKLQEQPFQILAMLLTRPGEVVTREELRAKLWPADTFVDFDHGLNSAINKLREALGDSADDPRFIETLPRRGYRFLAVVDVPARPQAEGARSEAKPPAAEPQTHATAPLPARQRHPWGILLAALAVVAGLALIVASNLGGLRDRLLKKPATVRIQSLAVLPLENLSKDTTEEYFADGMTDELIAALAKIGALRVISRTSVMQYKGTKKPLPQIARELNVDGVVEGSVLRSGDRVRINAELLYAPADRHLWAESYERELRDVLALQSDVASSIAREIQVKVTPQEQARLSTKRPVNPEAYEAYLRGRAEWERVTPESLSRAVHYFEQAIAKDPRYAVAYAGLADSYANLAGRVLPPKEAMPKARKAALQALEMDPESGEGHASLALVKLFYDYDWSGAESESKRALELNPGNARLHGVYASYLVSSGHVEEALRELRRARELDPLSPYIRCGESRYSYYARKYDDAVELFHKAEEMAPRLPDTCLWSGLAYVQKSMYKEAAEQIQKVSAASPQNTLALAALVRAYDGMGRRAEAQRLLRHLLDLSKQEYVSPYNIAVAYIGIEDKEQAFAWLERAFSDRAGLLVYLKVDPYFDPLRSDPRFQDLLRRIGIPN